MKKNKFDVTKDISELLLQMISADIGNPLKKTPLEKTREALRRYSAEEIEKAYTNAVRAVGSELEFSSAQHLATGLVGPLSDAIYTLWDPVKQVIQSPVVSQAIEEKVGEGKTLIDYLVAERSKDKSAEEREKSVQDMNKSLEVFRKSEAYAQAITDYCQETGKTPDKVLRSKKEMVGIIQKVYGSVKEYEKIELESIKGLSKLVDKLDELQNIPFGVLIPALIKSKVSNINDLSEIGVNPATIGRIIQCYISDVAKFGKAFLTERAKHATSEIKQYKTLARKS